LTDNVELILKTINNQHSIESQDNDQPDYDSVASDEDTDLETSGSKANRQKVRGHSLHERTDVFLLKLLLQNFPVTFLKAGPTKGIVVVRLSSLLAQTKQKWKKVICREASAESQPCCCHNCKAFEL
jgi:hypothetical protein